MKLKKLVALVLALAMALALVACGGSSSNSGTTGGDSSTGGAAATGTAGEYTTDSLTVNIWDNNQLAGLQEIADDWSAESGVSVSIEVVTWDSYWTLLEAGASGGQMPDVFWMHSNTAQMYMENDMLLDLTSYIERDGIDKANYYEGVWDLYTRSDGNVYALPKDHDTIALLYNKAIFDQYGVAYPDDTWTYEDMYEAAKAITEGSNGDVYGVAMNTSNNQDGWYNIVQAYGGEIITEDHKDTTIDSDAGKAGMEMVRKLLTVGAPQTVVAETGTDSLFQSGKTAMITQGSWMILSFYQSENAADYAWAMLPYADVNGDGECQQEERASAYNGLGWAAAATVSDPEAAWSLIKYFCSEDAQLKQSELGVTMGGMTGVSDAFASAFDGMDTSAFFDVEEQGTLFFRPYTRNTTVWEDALQQAGGFLDLWQNPDDETLVSTSCDNAAKIIRDAIAAE